MSKRLKIIIAAVVVVAAVAGAGLYWFFKDDAPPPVSLEAATESVTDTTSATTTATGVDGTWTVDTSTGDFDYESRDRHLRRLPSGGRARRDRLHDRGRPHR